MAITLTPFPFSQFQYLALNMARSNCAIFFIISAIFFLFVSSSSAQPVNQTCQNYNFSDQYSFVSCQDLPVLNSFIHWTYDPSSNIVDLAFRKTRVQPNTWISWAINPSSRGMVGSQAFVAFQESDGTMKAYTSPVTSYGTRLQEGNLSFPVIQVSSVSSNDAVILFAKFKLPTNSTIVNHLWQEGRMRANVPGAHSMTGDNLNSYATVDFSSGKIVATKGPSGGLSSRRNHWKRVHGGLNAVSWGTLMPLGVIFARYLKIFPSADPAWFYLHVSCQLSGYLMGITGGMIGWLVLGKQSAGGQRSAHSYIGGVLFALATLQILALIIRPKKDHKYRFYWEIYHHAVGYSTIILGICNVFVGLKILDDGKWSSVYTGVFFALLSMVAVLEVFKCLVQRRRSKTSINESKAEENSITVIID